ncbi:hypothetical protein EZV62_011581 [Acer yangbiense]|uniref:Uncharacterized protein n=1 Tax=Acer yangbiense TaxID=1000413 RepID=A0A5C7I5R0_9ROSI|nr:hypothetical protein EZV62_011581 [Acer yangbiense]
MFTNGWAQACKVGNINDVFVPNFEAGILFPPRDTPVVKVPSLSNTTSQIVAKRFVLDTNTISKLKAEVTSSCGGGHMHKTSTTEVVIAIIWRAQINAARARYGFLRTSLLCVAINLRGKTLKKVPENCCGNIYTVGTARFVADDETKMGLNGFVDQACKVGNINDVIVPHLEAGILFPPRDTPVVKLPSLSKTTSQVVTKRFVFNANTISKLKADVMTPSTTEVVIALIWRAQINAARARNGFLRTSLLSVAVNLRGKTFKKVPENCCGNIYTVGTARHQADETKMGSLNVFVDQVRDADGDHGVPRNSNVPRDSISTGMHGASKFSSSFPHSKI